LARLVVDAHELNNDVSPGLVATLRDDGGERSGVTDDDEQRFTELWARCSPRVMAYCLRHADRDTAEEVVSETFLVAWRRSRESPSGRTGMAGLARHLCRG
jgi:DNA-directed RNA polymerase specialized sigma24 family protein